MAKAKTSKKSKAKKRMRYAVQRHIEVSTLNTTNKNILDVPKFLSEANHRLYRQSRVYRSKINILGPTSEANGLVHVYVLRDTWMLQKAYQMAKDTFDKNTVEERSGISPVNMARWQDFRISLTPANGQNYTPLAPTARNNGTLSKITFNNGEFVNSIVTNESSADMTFGLFGQTNARWSIIGEYDKTADVDDDPANTVSGANISAYSGLDNDNDDGSRNHLQTAGNSPPYDPDSLGADTMFRRVATLGGGIAALAGASNPTSKTTTGFFDAPLGMILIEVVGANEPPEVELEVASGDYKGVAGEAYLDLTKQFSHRKG